MKIQIVSKYLALAEEGLVPRMDCPLDQGLLVCNLSEKDEIFLYCLSCEYKSIIGLKMYDKLKEQVEKNAGR